MRKYHSLQQVDKIRYSRIMKSQPKFNFLLNRSQSLHTLQKHQQEKVNVRMSPIQKGHPTIKNKNIFPILNNNQQVLDQQLPQIKLKTLPSQKSANSQSIKQLNKIIINQHKQHKLKPIQVCRHHSSQKSLNKMKQKQEVQVDSIVQRRVQRRNKASKVMLPSEDKPLKIQRASSLKKIIPQSGYHHLQVPFEIGNTIHCTISSNGVIMSDENETKFYKIEQFENYLVKIQNLKKIDYFKHFSTIKCLNRWKHLSLRKKYKVIQNMINSKVKYIYCAQMNEIKQIYSGISSYKYIKNGDLHPLEIQKFAHYLHQNSYNVINKIITYDFLKVINIMLKPIRKKMDYYLDKKVKDIEKQKNVKKKVSKKIEVLKLSIETYHRHMKKQQIDFQNTYNFKLQLAQVQSFLKKAFYLFAHFHLEWQKNITQEIISKISSLFNAYLKTKDKIKQSLKNLFNPNFKEPPQQKHQIYELQMKQILYICRFQIMKNDQKIQRANDQSKSEIKNKKTVQLDQTSIKESVADKLKLQKNIIFKISEFDIVKIFQQLVQHIVAKLSQKEILNCYKYFLTSQYRQGKCDLLCSKQNQIQLQILNIIISSNDVYNSQNLLDEQKAMKNFKSQLGQLINQNIEEVKEIIELLNFILNEVFDYYNSQNKDSSYILSYSILEETKSKIKLIPDELMAGLFIIDIQNIKNYLQTLIQLKFAQLTKDLPEQFKKCFEYLFEKLTTYSKQINLSVWTIKQFLVSYRYKEQFEQYREELIYKDQDKLKNILTAISKTLPKTYEECYVISLKVKDIIQKIDTKIQTFDLNCIKKLKYFKNEIQNLSFIIYNKLLHLKNSISQIDDFEEQDFLPKTLSVLHEYQQQLKKIKQDMDNLNYIQTLEIRFNLKQSLTNDFNLYEKSQSDVKLLKTIIKKLLMFEQTLSNELNTQITCFNCEIYLQEIASNKSQLKTSQKYLISFFKLLKRITNCYQRHKNFIQTVNQLSVMSQNQIQQILNHLSYNIKTGQTLSLSKLKQLNIQKHADQICYLIQKKEKKKKMDLIISEVQVNINDLALLAQVVNIDDTIFNQNISSNISTISIQKKEPLKLSLTGYLDSQKNKLEVSYLKGFLNIRENINLIKHIQNQLKQLVVSPFLEEQKKQLFNKLQYVNNIEEFLSTLQFCQQKILKLISQGAISSSLKTTSQSSQIAGEKQSLKQKEFKFDSKIQKQILNSWITILKKFHAKKFNQIAFYFLQYKIEVVNFLNSIQAIERLMNIKINQKKNIFSILHFFNNQNILKFILNPREFIFLIFPTEKLQTNDQKTYVLTSKYEQKIYIQFSSEPTMFIKAFYEKVIQSMKQFYLQNSEKIVIDQINYFIEAKIPLQIVYIIDQLNLQFKYADLRQQFISNILEQIKIISKLRREKCEDDHSYKMMLIDMLIGARIQYRHKVQYNTSDSMWTQSILIYEVDKDDNITLRNLNNLVPISYIFSDSYFLTTPFPGSEKTLFKICEAFSGYFPCFYIHQSNSLRSICARTMNLLLQIQFKVQCVEDICKGFVLNNPVIGLINFNVAISYEFISSIFRNIQKLKNEILNKQLTQFSNIKIANHSFISNLKCPSFFVMTKTDYTQMSKELKLLFKQISYIHPNYNLLVMTKLQTCELDNFLLLQPEIFHFVQGYFKVYKEITKRIPNYDLINKFIGQIIERLKYKKESQYKEVIQNFLVEEYSNIGCSQQLLLKALNLSQSQSMYKKKSQQKQQRMITQKKYLQLHFVNQKNNKGGQQTKIKSILQENMSTFKDSIRLIYFYPNEFFIKFDQALSIITNQNNLNNHQYMHPMLIFGSSGSGKTTLIKMLSQYLSNIDHFFLLQAYHQFSFSENAQLMKQTLANKEYRKKQNKSKYSLLTIQIENQETSQLMNTIIKLSDQIWNQKTRIQKNKPARSCRYLFQIKSIKTVPPNIFLSCHKIYMSNNLKQPEVFFKIWVKTLLLRFNIPEANENYLKYFDLFYSTYSLLNQAYESVVKLNNTYVEWIIEPNFQNILSTTTKLFQSFVNEEKAKLEVIGNTDKQNLVLKIMFYCIFWSLIYCAQNSSYQAIQKTLKDLYNRITQCKNKQNFLYKILINENNEYQFTFLKVLSDQAENQTQHFSLIVQNFQMKCFSFFASKFQERHHNILVFGKEQAGKSTFIENYFHKSDQKMFIRLKGANKKLIEVLRKELNEYENKKKEQKHQSNSKKKKLLDAKKEDLLIWIQNIQLYNDIHPIESYLKFLQDFKQYHFKKQKKAFSSFKYLIERSYLCKDYLTKNWNLSIMVISTSQSDLQNIFTQFLQNIFDKMILFNSAIEELKSQIPSLVVQHLGLIKFYRQTYKQTLQNWTYYISNEKYKTLLQDIFENKKPNFLSALPANQIIFKINFSLFLTLYCSLKSKSHSEAFLSRVTKFLELSQDHQINEISFNEQLSERQQLIYTQNEEQKQTRYQKLSLKIRQKKYFKNALIYPMFCRNFEILKYILANKTHILVNKIIISSQYSFLEMALEVLGLNWFKMTQPDTEWKFLEYLNKIAISNRQIKKCYIYVSYEAIKLYPSYLQWIVNYIQNSRSLADIKNQKFEQIKFTVNFLVQYSDFDMQGISKYLWNKVLNKFTVIRYHSPQYVDYEQIGMSIIVSKHKDQEISKLKQINAIINRCFMQIANLNNKQFSLQLQKFIKEHVLSIKNYLLYLTLTAELYFKRLGTSDLKKNSLQFTLSQINGLLREFKALKQQQLNLYSKKKQLLKSLESSKIQFQKSQKKLQILETTSKQTGIEYVSKLIKTKHQFIKQLEDKEAKLYKMASNLSVSLNRGELAELKYIFVNNFASQKDIFECICLILNESLDIANMKKCFMDISLANRLRDLKIQEINIKIMFDLKDKLKFLEFQKTQQKYIIQWLKTVSNYRILKHQNEKKIPMYLEQIGKLQTELNVLYDNNEIDHLRERISELKNSIFIQTKELERVDQKLKQINIILSQLSQFEEFQNFKKDCLIEKEDLEEGSKNFLYYSILEVSDAILFSLFRQKVKKKFKSNLINILRRKYNFSVNQIHLNLFQSLYKQEEKQQSIIQLRKHLPNELMKVIRYANKLLKKDQENIVIIDPNNSFKSLVQMNSALIIDIQNLHQKQGEINNYKCIIININTDNWEVSIKQISKNTKIQKRVIQYNTNKIVIPGQIHIFFRKTSIGSYTELMNKFKMFIFQISQENYYQMIKMIIIEELIKAKQKTSLQVLMSKHDVAKAQFSDILYYFCQNNNQISLTNVQFIKSVLYLIHSWKLAEIQANNFQYQVFQEKNQNQSIKKIYKILSKIFKIVENYFPESNLQSEYFLHALYTATVYSIYNFGDQRSFILHYVLSMVIYSLRNKDMCLALFYMKVFAIQQGICTLMQSQNLVFTFSELDQLQGIIIQNIENDTFNYLKYLPYQNKELQNFIRKISIAKQSQNKQKTVEMIDACQNFSYFQKLLLKRILQPDIFEKEIQHRVKQLQLMIIKNNDNFIKKFFQKGLLYCKSDIYFWRKNIKLKLKYEEIFLSKINFQIHEYDFSMKPYFIVDDFQISDSADRTKLLQKLIELNHLNSIFFSHLEISFELLTSFKQIPFLLFLQIYCFIDEENLKNVNIISSTDKKHISSDRINPQNKNFIKQHYQQIIRNKSFDQRSIILSRFSNSIPLVMELDKVQDKLILFYYWKIFIWHEKEFKLNFFNFKETFTSNQLLSLEHQQNLIKIKDIFELLLDKESDDIVQQAQRVYKDHYTVINKYISKQINLSQYEQQMQKQIFLRQHLSIVNQIQNIQNLSKDIAGIKSNKYNIDSQRITYFIDIKKKFSLKNLNKSLLWLVRFRNQMDNQFITYLNFQLISSPIHFLFLFPKLAYRIHVMKSESIQKQLEYKSQINRWNQKSMDNTAAKKASQKQDLEIDNYINMTSSNSQISSKKQLKNTKKGLLQKKSTTIQFSQFATQNIQGKKTYNLKKNNQKLVIQKTKGGNKTNENRINPVKSQVIKAFSEKQGNKKGEAFQMQKMLKLSDNGQTEMNEDKDITILNESSEKIKQAKDSYYRRKENIANLKRIYIFNQNYIVLNQLQKKQYEKMNLNELCIINFFESFQLKTFFIRKVDQKKQIEIKEQNSQLKQKQQIEKQKEIKFQSQLSKEQQPQPPLIKHQIIFSSLDQPHQM